MRALAFADITVGAQQLLGGTIGGTLITMAMLIARRTKDTDEARDRVSQLVLDHALEREGRAQGDIDTARSEREAARAEARAERDRADRLVEVNAALRERNAALEVELRGAPYDDRRSPRSD